MVAHRNVTPFDFGDLASLLFYSQVTPTKRSHQFIPKDSVVNFWLLFSQGVSYLYSSCIARGNHVSQTTGSKTLRMLHVTEHTGPSPGRITSSTRLRYHGLSGPSSFHTCGRGFEYCGPSSHTIHPYSSRRNYPAEFCSEQKEMRIVVFPVWHHAITNWALVDTFSLGFTFSRTFPLRFAHTERRPMRRGIFSLIFATSLFLFL